MRAFGASVRFVGYVEGDSIGKRLQSLRESVGLTQKEFADKCGLKLRQVQSFEQNRQQSTRTADPSIDTIARRCGVQPVWLYAGSDSPKRFWPEWWTP